jgi:pimeloyl-ACP methyl ester carboxylesterase
MDTKTNSDQQAPTPAEKRYATDTVISADGTTIGYRQYGHGPGIVLVEGATLSAHNFAQLAEAMADTFTVYVPDRRGRGMSDLPFSKDYDIQRDIEDLAALLTQTGTHFVFGLSSGALISLQAALTLPAIRKVAIYEPPFFMNGLPTALMARLTKEIDQGKLAAALITGMKAGQMGPPILNSMPSFLIVPLIKMAMSQEEKKGSGEYLPMKVTAPTLQYDFKIVGEMHGKIENFRNLNTETLLLGGSKSPAYLKADLDALEKVLPHATRIEFPGLDHGSAGNYDKQRNANGQPEVVARELRQFFGEPEHFC